MDLSFVLALAVWAAVDYFAADFAVKKLGDEGFAANPILYALGAVLIGGIYPLLFLGLKVIWFKYKNSNNKNKDNEIDELRRRLNELENKNQE